MTLSMGPAWAAAGQTQTFYLSPEVERSYVANKQSGAMFDGDLFLGVQRALNGVVQAQVGLDLGYSGNAVLHGAVWDDANPLFDNHTYSYRIQHGVIAAKGKLLVDNGYFMMPWVSGSAGIGFNRAGRYQNTPVIFEAEVDPNFTSHTKTSFSYTLGAGAQRAIDDHWQVGIGYEYADWGKSQLNRAPGQMMNTGLQLGHLYANALLFNVSYLA